MRNLNLAATLLLFFCLSAPFRGHSQCSIDYSQWTPVVNEDFNYSNIQQLFQNGWDPNHDYAPHNLNSNTNVLYRDNEIGLSNGCLYLYNRRAPAGTTYNGQPVTTFSGGIRCNRKEYPSLDQYKGFLYGMFEIRCKLPDLYESYPAFWLDGGLSATWPPEIDVFEQHGGDPAFFSTIHWRDQNNQTQGCGNTFHFPVSGRFFNNWHTYTVVWTPYEVTWFFDGKEIRKDNDVSHLPGRVNYPLPTTGSIYNFINYNRMVLRLENGTQEYSTSGSSNPVWNNEPLVVDYIRVYKPNGYQPFTGNSGNVDNYYNNIFQLFSNTPYKTGSDWYFNTIVPQSYYPNEDVNATKSYITALQGGGKYFYKGAGGLLWCTYYGTGGFYNVPADYSHQVRNDVALSRNGDEVFFLCNDGYAYSYRNNAFTQLPYQPSSNLKPLNSGTEVFFVDSRNRVEFARNVNGTWVSPLTISESLLQAGFNPFGTSFLGRLLYAYLGPIYGDFASDLIVDPSNSNTVYYISIQNKIQSVTMHTGALPSFQTIGTADVGSCLAITPGGNQLFYKSTSGELRTVKKNGLFWNTTSSSFLLPGSTQNVGRNLLVNPHPNNLQLYYVGTDNKIYVAYFNGSGYTVGPIRPADFNTVQTNLALITYGQNTTVPHLVYCGADNRIRTVEFVTGCDRYAPCEAEPVMKRADTFQTTAAQARTAPAAADGLPDHISINPNPVTDAFTVTSRKNIRSVDVYSLSGAQVQSHTSPGQRELRINARDLAPGVYITTVTLEDGSSFRGKIVKQ